MNLLPGGFFFFLITIVSLFEEVVLLPLFKMLSFMGEDFLMVWEFGLLYCPVLGMIKYLVRDDGMAQGIGNGIYRAFHP